MQFIIQNFRFSWISDLNSLERFSCWSLEYLSRELAEIYAEKSKRILPGWCFSFFWFYFIVNRVRLQGIIVYNVCIFSDRRSSSRGWKKFVPLETVCNPGKTKETIWIPGCLVFRYVHIKVSEIWSVWKPSSYCESELILGIQTFSQDFCCFWPPLWIVIWMLEEEYSF